MPNNNARKTALNAKFELFGLLAQVYAAMTSSTTPAELEWCFWCAVDFYSVVEVEDVWVS